MDFSKDYEIKIYKNKCAFSNMKRLENGFLLEEIKHYAGKNKTNICKNFSYNFRDYFKIDSSMFYTVNRYPNNRKLYLINYQDYECLYAVGIIGLHYNEYVDGYKTWTLNWAWIHPFMRNKGILKNSVDYLEKIYGPLIITDILSREMELFALKYNKIHNLHFKYYMQKKEQNKIYETSIPNLLHE